MTDPKYAAFTALDPFFDIVQQGFSGLADGDHYFDTIADEAESRLHENAERDAAGEADRGQEEGPTQSLQQICEMLHAHRSVHLSAADN